MTPELPVLIGLAAVVLTVWIVRVIVRFKRPRRCTNCGRRPRWAFDTTARDGRDLERDHAKACLA